MWESHIRISTALMSSNGNIHISNRKQSYIMNTGTWNNNTCNKHGDPYDKKIETQACVTVICKHDMNAYDDHANMKCSSPCSDMPRIHVPRITIHDITVFREMVSLRIGGYAYEITSVSCQCNMHK